MPLFNGMTGSTGAASALRIEKVIDRFRVLPSGRQTSAAWTDLYDNRVAYFPEDGLDQAYIIGGGEANTPLGYFAFYRRLLGSTRNTSSGGTFSVLGLPDPIWSDLSTIVDTAIAAETTVNDNGIGDIVFYIISNSTVNYLDGAAKATLAAWAATTLVQESTANTLRDSS